MIRSSYFLELSEEEVPLNTPWIINHNLGSMEVIVSALGLEIESVKILDKNNVMLNVSELWWGEGEYEYKYELFILRIGDEKNKKSIIDNISYLKIGYGKSKHWNALFEGDLNKPYDNKYNVDIYEFDEYYAVKSEISPLKEYLSSVIEGESISISNLIDMYITEMGLFDKNDRILFYTKCSTLYKPKDVDITIWYRIIK